MSNSRFNDLGNGIITEMIAHQTQLFYDPTTQHPRAIFNGSSYLQLASGQYVALGDNHDMLHVDFMDKLADCVGKAADPEGGIAGDIDPVTQADLSQVSVYGIMILMKRAYDKYHNERAAQIAADIAAAEAEAAAQQAQIEADAAAAALPPPEEPTP